MLVTLSEVKTYLGIVSVNTDSDAFLNDQITLLTDVIQAYCRRDFLSASYVQTYYSSDYDPGQLINTFQFPLVSVTSITEDGDVVDPTTYRVHYPTGQITKQYGCFYFAEETVVTYTAGYAATPSPVKSVIFNLIQERYNKKSSGVDLNFGSDVQRISIPGAISIDFDYSLSNNDRKSALGTIIGSQANVLDYYRSERSITGAGKLAYL
jgi:hypothetical protein